MTAHPLPAPAARTSCRRDADTPRRSIFRWPAIAALLVAAAAHIPVTAPHLHEASYIGSLFIALTVACIALAAVLAVAGTPTVWDLTVWVSGLAVLAYVLSRTAGLPQITDDIGNWTEPLGLTSIAAESVAVLCGLTASLTDRRHRKQR